MKRYLLILCVFVLFSCKKEQGCTDQIAINFNSTAEEDDGSCNYSVTGGYWITQSSTQLGSITTSVSGTIVSDSTFNYTETNADSLSPYKLEFLDNNTYTETDNSNNIVDSGTWSLNGNQLTLNPGDTIATLTVESIDRDNVVISTSLNEISAFMGITITYDVTLTINCVRQF
tara:strand:+ start:60 stop:578 length:519 start_codon:yes stop_codon:yes gene_type:complete